MAAAADQSALPGLELPLPRIVCPPSASTAGCPPAAPTSGDHELCQPQCGVPLQLAGPAGAAPHLHAFTPRGAEALVPSLSVDSTALDAACMAPRPAPAVAAPEHKVSGLASASPGLPSPACVAARPQLAACRAPRAQEGREANQQ